MDGLIHQWKDELRAVIEEFDNDKDGESEYNEWMDDG